MAEHFDVIIVGARCAGSPLAVLLARAGLRVCVLDRAAFPSDTPSTHGIQPCGVQVLDRLGVGESVRAVAATIERGTLVTDDVRIELDQLSERVGAPMLNARRVTLDALLVEAAAGAGADVRPRTAVSALLEEGGHVVGVETSRGPLRASLVVGADGARSTVARLVGAAEYHCTPPGGIFLWGYFAGAEADDDRLWLGQLGERGYLASPTDDGLFIAAVVVSADGREAVRADREAAYDEGVAHWPELHAAVAGARRVGPVQMMGRWHGFFRESAGPGWVLVGDAGHFKDPTPGQGIADALRQVEALAPAIERALDGDEDALRAWWAWRDRDAWEMYWFARDLGAAGPSPLLLREAMRRIAADRRLTDGLMRVLNHELAPSEVFTPRFALGAVGGAFASGRWPRRVLAHEAREMAGREVRRRLAARSRPRTGARARPGAPAASRG